MEFQKQLIKKILGKLRVDQRLASLVCCGFFAFLLFSYFAFEVAEGQNSNWLAVDNAVFAYIVHHRSGYLTEPLLAITNLASSVSASLFAFTTLLYAHFNGLRSERRVMLLVSLGSIACIRSTKFVMSRVRPQMEYWLTPVDSYSFPSGHSAAAMAVGGAIFYLLGRSCPIWRQKIAVWVFGGCVIILVGFSRVYLGVHYPLDVLGGFLMGLTVLLVAVSIDLNIALREGDAAWFKK